MDIEIDSRILDAFAGRTAALRRLSYSINIELRDNTTILKAFDELYKSAETRAALEMRLRENAVTSAEQIPAYGFFIKRKGSEWVPDFVNTVLNGLPGGEASHNPLSRSGVVDALLTANGHNALYSRNPGEAALIYCYDTDCTCKEWNDLMRKHGGRLSSMLYDGSGISERDTAETLQKTLIKYSRISDKNMKRLKQHRDIITYESLRDYVSTYSGAETTVNGEIRLVTGDSKTQKARDELNTAIQAAIAEKNKGLFDLEGGFLNFCGKCGVYFSNFRFRTHYYLAKAIYETIATQIEKFLKAQTAYLNNMHNSGLREKYEKSGQEILLTGKIGDMIDGKPFSKYLQGKPDGTPLDRNSFSGFEVKPASIYYAYSKFYNYYTDIEPKYMRLMSLLSKYEEDYDEYNNMTAGELRSICADDGVAYSESDNEPALIVKLISAQLRPELLKEYGDLDFETIQALCKQFSVRVGTSSTKSALIKKIIDKELAPKALLKFIGYNLMLYNEEYQQDDSIEDSPGIYDNMAKEILQALCLDRRIKFDKSAKNQVLADKLDAYDYYSILSLGELQACCVEQKVDYNGSDDRISLMLKLTIAESEKQHIKARKISNNAAQALLPELLLGTRDVSREFLTLFLVFLGKGIDKINDILRCCGYLPLYLDETRPFDVLICSALSKPVGSRGRFITKNVIAAIEKDPQLNAIYNKVKDSENFSIRSAAI